MVQFQLKGVWTKHCHQFQLSDLIWKNWSVNFKTALVLWGSNLNADCDMKEEETQSSGPIYALTLWWSYV
jgi:hypothetical protein